MKEVMGLRFIPNGPLTYYEKGSKECSEDYQKHDKVIVHRAEYEEIGEVVIPSRLCQDRDVVEPARAILRKASHYDLAQAERNDMDAKQALQICRKKVRELGLEMKVIHALYAFDRNKLTFLFTADGRVDFRLLVRELAAIFHVRIELRQIGSRDEAKLLGGLGPCGRPLCCSTFLGDFAPVSIKMAKDQGLSLNTTKISGICGRLMCCLTFENDVYEEAKRAMPDYGDEVDTPDGRGRVTGLNFLSRVVRVKLFQQHAVMEYAWEELQSKSLVK